MSNHTARFGLFLIFAAAVVCLCSPSIFASMVDIPASSDDSKPVPAEDLGIGNFSKLPFKVSISVRSGYDDNVTTSSFGKQGSWFTGGNIAVDYDFGSPRTQLSLGAGAGATYYWETIHSVGVNTSDYDINTFVNLALTHKATPRLTLSVAAYLTYQTEPDFSIAQGINRRAGNYFFTTDKFTVGYLWTPRFSTVTSYTLTALNYDDMAVGVFSDRFENIFGNEFRFLLWPTTSVVAEYRLQIVSYIHDGDVITPALIFSGVKLLPATRLHNNSTTHFALGGFDHAFNPRLSLSVRAGAEFRDFESGGSDSSPYFEGTLSYILGKQTSVSWTNRYAIEEPDLVGSQTRETFRTGVSAKHDITPRISGNVGAYYEHDDYQGNGPFTEESFDLAISLRYSVTRHFGVEAGYNYTDVWSDIPIREYSRSRYWGGLNVSF